MNRLFTVFIVLGMGAGVAAGWAVREYLEPDIAQQVVAGLGLVTDAFLRLIRMIVAPLVFSTLVVGIAKMEDMASVGRIGAKTLFLFIIASLISLSIGLFMVRWLEPGAGFHMAVAGAQGHAPKIDTTGFTIKDFIEHLIPSSIVDAMAKNEILQIVVFSVFVGTAVAALEHKAPAVVALVDEVAQIMLKVTSFVMWFAPFAIFAALASTVAKYGLDVIQTYARYVGGFYMSLGLLWALLFVVGFLFLGFRIANLFVAVRQPVLLAFSTASSEAAYPKTLEQLERFGIPLKIASFVLPLGYSFNLMGSMMYCTFAIVFICQVYGIDLSLQEQISLLLLLMVMSKGLAGVPRAALVVLMAALAYFKLPLGGMALIIAVDQLLDMGRTGTNVLGNSVAAAIVARWEGELGGQAARTSTVVKSEERA
jgi:Na+/H+-dicarboxylate symporter